MSRTSEFYKKNPEAAEKRREAQRKINKKPSQKKYRAELNQKRKELGMYGNGGGDISHKKAKEKGGSLKDGYKIESPSKNRARK